MPGGAQTSPGADPAGPEMKPISDAGPATTIQSTEHEFSQCTTDEAHLHHHDTAITSTVAPSPEEKNHEASSVVATESAPPDSTSDANPTITTTPTLSSSSTTNPTRTISLPPDASVRRLLERAGGSAGKLVNLLTHHFPSFRDEARFDGRKVRFLKRAQIFVADLWAALRGQGCGAFEDIDGLTMFAGEFLTISFSFSFAVCVGALLALGGAKVTLGRVFVAAAAKRQTRTHVVGFCCQRFPSRWRCNAACLQMQGCVSLFFSARTKQRLRTTPNACKRRRQQQQQHDSVAARQGKARRTSLRMRS